MCTCASYAHALMILEMSSGPTRRVLCINKSEIACQPRFRSLPFQLVCIGKGTTNKKQKPPTQWVRVGGTDYYK